MTKHRDGQAGQRWVEHTVGPEHAGETVEQILTGPLQVSRRMIQRLTRTKGIQLNGRPAFLKKKVSAGDRVRARTGFVEEPGIEPIEMELDIVYEDEDVLVVNKPAYLLVHPTNAGQNRTLAHGIAFHYGQKGYRAKVRPVHRLDRDTSGLVLFAGTGFAHQHLDRQLREGTFRREYLALVDRVIVDDSGTIDAPIGRHPRQRHLRAVRTDGDSALTRFRVVERFPGATLLQVELETGRTHQIRVHLAHAGHPVIGDRQYGSAGSVPLNRQALHAFRISFLHPSSNDRLSFEVPLPEDMAQLRERLRLE